MIKQYYDNKHKKNNFTRTLFFKIKVINFSIVNTLDVFFKDFSFQTLVNFKEKRMRLVILLFGETLRKRKETANLHFGE